ncbi:MAG: hypothetical protein ABIU77_15255 [Ferruginibacter sp.]
MIHSGIKNFIFILIVLAGNACNKNKPAQLFAVQQSDSVSNPTTLIHMLPSVLKESSGLCYTDGNLWSFGDSGNPPNLYKIDTATGTVLQTVTISNYPNVDWEDITADSAFIYIGDFGNNYGDRKDLKILRIRKSEIAVAASSVSLGAEAINFSYNDQTDFTPNDNTNFDCEAVIVVNDYLYLFTKDRGDLKTRCYKIPAIPATYNLSPLSTFNSQGKITAAAYNPQSKEIALLGYMNKKVQSFIWLLNGYTTDQFFNGTTKRLNIGTQADWQTEGLDYISADRFFMSCESSANHGASLYNFRK